MKLGIKVAPGNAWKHNIEATHPQMVEIWYNAGKPSDYDDIFSYLASRDIDVGLHYWGALPNGLLTNISYPDPTVTGPSLELMYATIDVATAHKCSYVNVHPDLYALLHVNFDSMAVRVASKPADIHTVNDAFVKQITALHNYAASKNVILTVETVPMRDTPSWKPHRNRTHVINTYPIPIDIFADLTAQGVCIANDFGHTACNMISDDRNAIWRFLYEKTRALTPATRLIHLGFIVPPYNGVDFHDSLDNPALTTTAAIPNTTEMIELLRIFQNRDDVSILVEPAQDHVKNYFLAMELLEKAGVLTKKG